MNRIEERLIFLSVQTFILFERYTKAMRPYQFQLAIQLFGSSIKCAFFPLSTWYSHRKSKTILLMKLIDFFCLIVFYGTAFEKLKKTFIVSNLFKLDTINRLRPIQLLQIFDLKARGLLNDICNNNGNNRQNVHYLFSTWIKIDVPKMWNFDLRVLRLDGAFLNSSDWFKSIKSWIASTNRRRMNWNINQSLHWIHHRSHRIFDKQNKTLNISCLILILSVYSQIRIDKTAIADCVVLTLMYFSELCSFNIVLNLNLLLCIFYWCLSLPFCGIMWHATNHLANFVAAEKQSCWTTT